MSHDASLSAVCRTKAENLSQHQVLRGLKKRNVSFFEFWPAWVMYFPAGVQWLFLSVWYRSFTLPFLANPFLTLSGMVGVPKSELMAQATGLCRDTILPWIRHTVDDRSPHTQAMECVRQAARQGIDFPFVCKPDIGCRGIGVKLVRDVEQLSKIIQCYPSGAALICQKLASWEAEVGIFYVKNPATQQAEITSLTFKHIPKVTGDGIRTLGQLVQKDERAGLLQHLYYKRHEARWNDIPSKGEVVSLVFSAAHSKGAVFLDAREHITPQLTKAVSDIMAGLPDFYYGRLDVKYSSLENLKAGKTLEIVEINGASAESIHVWDKDAKFFEAICTLLWQYRILFRIGAYHRKRGMKPPTLRTFLKHWRLEKNLSKHYPLTD